MELKKLQDFKKIVIKVGSSLIVDNDSNQIREDWLESFIEDIHDLAVNQNKQVILVCSGATALGNLQFGLTKNSQKIVKNRSVASIGQVSLITLLQKHLAKFNMFASQLLFTLDDTEKRNRATNIYSTIDYALSYGAIPLVNENDTMATDEIKYGDNDRLAARLAQITMADCLVLLTDVDGFYDKNPNKYKDAKLVKTITNIDANIIDNAGSSNSDLGSGGMLTKINAAEICQYSGCYLAIANGTFNNPIRRLQTSDNCTWVIPKKNSFNARQKWIYSLVAVKGLITIDGGAEDAINNNKSLLSVGIKSVEGEFVKGDFIKIHNQDNIEVARGIASLSAFEVAEIKGKSNREISQKYPANTVVVHKNDLTLCQNI